MITKTIAGRACSAVIAGALAVSIALPLTGCSSGAVAATVNGVELSETKVTEYMEQFREANDLTDDTTWAQWMVDNSYDAESIREVAIDYYVELMLIEQEAAANNVVVSDEEVDEAIAEVREYYELDDDEWDEQLDSAGYTEDSYWEYIYYLLLSDILQEIVITNVEVDDEDVLYYANVYSSYLDGVQDIDVIVFEAADVDYAKEALTQILDGTITFDEAKETVGGGDDYDGLYLMTGVDENITNVVTDLVAGDIVEEVVESDDAENYFIIRCNDVVSVPETTSDDSDEDSEDDGPWYSVDELQDCVYEACYELVYESNESTAYSYYLDEVRENADVVYYDMPEGLSYDVSTDGLTSSS